MREVAGVDYLKAAAGELNLVREGRRKIYVASGTAEVNEKDGRIISLKRHPVGLMSENHEQNKPA
jgi:hypothetical protein